MTAMSFPAEEQPPFVFVVDPVAVDPTVIVTQLEEGDLLVRVPAGIEDSQSLFRCFESALKFPGYFGWNWDAFRNCLLDLTWLDPMPIRILVVHEGLPFAADLRLLQIYLAVLADVSECDCGPTFQIVFPDSLADIIRREWASSNS